MILTRPLFYLAVIAAVASSFGANSYAQNPDQVASCDAFTTAIEAQGNATLVSGIIPEEAVTESTVSFIFPDFDNGLVTDIVGLPADTPLLTIPSGTLTGGGAFGDFLRGSFVGFQGTIDGVSTHISIFLDPSFAQIPQTLVFEPNAELGDACGICFVTAVTALEDAPTEINIYDGDTLLAQLDTRDGDLSFITDPGQTITSVELPASGLIDIVVAFCEEPVASPEMTNQECLASIAAEVGALADAATDSKDAYALNVACYALNFAAKDKFYEEDGNRLSRRGGNVFTGAAYAICYLEHTGVEGTEDIVDRILEKLEAIVDDEIDYAIENGGKPNFIERAEDFAELAEQIDEEYNNPFVAAIAYKLAWANAYFATY